MFERLYYINMAKVSITDCCVLYHKLNYSVMLKEIRREVYDK